jgi:hypothetical protein
VIQLNIKTKLSGALDKEFFYASINKLYLNSTNRGVQFYVDPLALQVE